MSLCPREKYSWYIKDTVLKMYRMAISETWPYKSELKTTTEYGQEIT